MSRHFSSYPYPKSFRLCSTKQFQKVFAARCSAADDTLILFALPNELPHSRLGLSVSKKVGNAVIRNRWKRLIREAFRQLLPDLPDGLDIVVLPQRNAKICKVKQIEESLKKLTAKIRTRCINQNPPKMPRKTILLTRPINQVEPMKTELESLGLHVLLQPAIEILPPEDWAEIDNAIQKLLSGEFDWLVFSSVNGIYAFFDRLQDSLSPHIQIAVVGSGTDDALYRQIGRRADVVPDIFTADAVTEALHSEAQQGKRFLHLRANRGRDVLKRLLTEAGGSVSEIAVYQSVDCLHADPNIEELLRSGKIDFVTVTSSAIACSLVNMFGELLRNSSLISISPLTSKMLCGLGFPPQFESAEASAAGIVNLLRQNDSLRTSQMLFFDTPYGVFDDSNVSK